MDSEGLGFVTSWGILIAGVGIIFIIFAVWCHDISEKLRYILEILQKGERGNVYNITTGHGLPAASPQVASGKPVPAFMTAGIIALAVVIFFILPIWLLTR